MNDKLETTVLTVSEIARFFVSAPLSSFSEISSQFENISKSDLEKLITSPLPVFVVHFDFDKHADFAQVNSPNKRSVFSRVQNFC